LKVVLGKVELYNNRCSKIKNILLKMRRRKSILYEENNESVRVHLSNGKLVRIGGAKIKIIADADKADALVDKFLGIQDQLRAAP
jgi:hypothetical protein